MRRRIEQQLRGDAVSKPIQVPPRCEFDLDKLVVKLDVVIPSNVAVIEDAVFKIMDIIHQTNCADSLEDVGLALHEALANALVHGNRVCVAVQEDCGVLIIVKDAGSGFDPSRVPSPLVGQNSLAGHGRGIFLISQLMDEVQIGFESGTAIYMWRRPIQKAETT
jgi:anti-sigma regulatory factor (Ser/Thr protein kinase)